MDSQLKDQLVFAMLRLRKVSMVFPSEFDIRMSELILMRKIVSNTSCPDQNFQASDLSSHLFITKPAVSQMLNSLEKKGYISREIDKNDRRKRAVTLTAEGQEILRLTKAFMDRKIETTIRRFGEENTKQLIALFSLLSDISEELNQENIQPKDKGEDHLD